VSVNLGLEERFIFAHDYKQDRRRHFAIYLV
jgi:hypothetical protein